MKTISRCTLTLRVIGTALLCLALLLSGYAAILSGAAWSQMSAQLSLAGAEAGFLARSAFTTGYFDALSRAASDPSGSAARAAAIQGNFDSFAALYDAALARKDEASAEAIYAYFADEFDFAAFLTAYDQREDNAEQLEIDKIYDYFDSLTAAPKPKGKVAVTVGAGQAEAFFPGYYEAFAAEHGEEAGTYYEFLRAVEAMLASYAAENAVTSAKAYMETVFDYDGYLAGREAVEAAEETAQSNSFLAAFAEMAAALPEGGASRGELVGFFGAEFEAVRSRYPGARYATFLSCARERIDARAAFDGSYKALIAAEKAADEAREAESFAAFRQTFAMDLVADADSRSAIAFVTVLWRLSAVRLYLLGAGIALALAAIVLKRALTSSMMKKQTFQREPDDPDVLLRVSHLRQYFKSGAYVNKAVNDISFFIKKGEVFGLVGESGCGKTTTGRTIINLYDPTDGDVYFQGLRISSTMNGAPVMLYQERAELNAKIKALKAERAAATKREPARRSEIAAKCAADIAREKRAFAQRADEIQRHAYESAEEKRRSQQMYRERRKASLSEEYAREASALSGEAAAARKRRYETEMAVASRDNIMTKMQMIFQDPIASINPRMTVREIIAEGLIIRGVKDKKYIDDKVQEMLELVGLVPEHADRYPHEFSGGQRQRIGIARAIALEPELIIADEPISALDVSIQAQVINLLNELRGKMGLTILFIAHNLSVVKYFSDRIAVMYYGNVVEMTTSDELFEHPLHPYTKSLLSAIPYPDPHYEKTRKRIEYNPAQQHDYTADKPSMREITPGHFIHCNDAEFERYRRELGL